MGPLQTQKAMAEIRHWENIQNSVIRRNKINGYAVPFICGCSRTCGGAASIREHVPAPPKPEVPAKLKRKGSAAYREWLRAHSGDAK